MSLVDMQGYRVLSLIIGAIPLIPWATFNIKRKIFENEHSAITFAEVAINLFLQPVN